MPDTLGLTNVLIRKAFASRRFSRQPEPMVMDGAEQVIAYADSARREDGDHGCFQPVPRRSCNVGDT